MRSPVEASLANQVALVRARRLAAGIPVDEAWSVRLRRRWPFRLMAPVECGPGWTDLIEALCELLDVEADGDFRFTQVKEKFGQLRCYWTGDDHSGRIDQLVEAAEEISASMCEVCGAHAAMRETRPGGYIYAACDEHARPGSDVIRVKTEKIRNVGFRIRAHRFEKEGGDE
ncbi:hypothetical protein [Bosea robiniae]|uniref:Uncharacterized protein n=1 Tax=Bosea robiniae TaxID=1036780 RepID=A0ABY0P463_9HYPH|nr:hypothetical protein [Bosea robiniae]SDH22228.1 hypothetical protein SAMN05421844_107202 [Bosea robiniae]